MVKADIAQDEAELGAICCRDVPGFAATNLLSLLPTTFQFTVGLGVVFEKFQISLIRKKTFPEPLLYVFKTFLNSIINFEIIAHNYPTL